MLATAYIDESQGNSDRLMIAAVVASWDKWRGFSYDWEDLLGQACVPYAHSYEMDRNQGPFGFRPLWNRERKVAFMSAQYEILKKWCQLGLTISLDRQIYLQEYRDKVPPKVTPYSQYGVAGLEMFLQIQRYCKELFSDVDAINFVWERGHTNLPNVAQIFGDLKDCYGERAGSLGAFIPMKRGEARPLEAVDQLCVGARQIEQEAKAMGQFASVPKGALLHDVHAMLPAGETFPIFYHDITGARMVELRDLTVEIKSKKRALRGTRA